MLTATIALGGIGLACAVCLGLVAKLFYVEVNPKIVAVEEALAGANCGGCGYAGCAQAAEAIVAGQAPANCCVANSQEGNAEVAAIMGVKLEAREAELSKPTCTYSVLKAQTLFDYDGAVDCRAAVLLYGGQKLCGVGCLGLGSCVDACPFDAIHLGPDRLPVIDPDKCTGCGACVKICPKGVLSLTSATNRVLAWNRLDECLAPC
ncbi:MAG: 4Fe-4S binding protein, partial [Deltaproteobacteria bacterium]|nr:4Fe-4S binding protein [Deltaproteobacteria bacterium]